MELRKQYKEFYNKKIRSANEIEKKYLKLLKEKINEITPRSEDSSHKNLFSSLIELEDKIKCITSLKTNYINIYYVFLEYLKKQNIKYSCSFSKSYLTETRRIELIKYFQEPRKEEDVLDEFMINSRTFRSDLKALEEGIDFCGTKLKIMFNKYNREGNITIDDERYHSSYNPFGLVLNMTELYLLTNVVPKMLKNSEIRNEYSCIINKIYPQLSEYAKGLIENEYCNYYMPREKFVLESKSIKDSAINQLIYVMKREKTCVVIYKTAEGVAKVEGCIRLTDNNNSFIIEKNDGNKQEILFKDFVYIENFFEKVYE